MTFRRHHHPLERPKDWAFHGSSHVPKLKAKVTIDRRKTRTDRRNPAAAVTPERKIERRVKVARRRQIDPTTCEREYTDEEIEFMHALEAYKRSSGRMFPTCSEVLEVLRGLGYERTAIAAK
jgi:hypothetical protein